MLSFLRNALDSGSSGSTASYSIKQTEPIIYFNVDGIRDSIPAIHWAQVAHTCARTVSPLCTAVRKTLHDDVEHLVQLFSELEAAYATELQANDEDCSMSVRTTRSQQHEAGDIFEMFRHEELQWDPNEPFTIRSLNPELPTIVITPCSTQEQDRSCWVPYQDAAFGNRLSVPMHPAVNDVFPPLMAKPLPFVEHWSFVNGHWKALLPTPEEQMQKGMFSRPLLARRRKGCWDARPRHASNTRRTTSQRQAFKRP
ncbi:unnamed protein product [Somion occarium]|uniref:Uncharacterized protein n=1 Tax=Somion occarium TaxID=3059160 RepID=A0ABP1CHY5_9APHY